MNIAENYSEKEVGIAQQETAYQRLTAKIALQMTEAAGDCSYSDFAELRTLLKIIKGVWQDFFSESVPSFGQAEREIARRLKETDVPCYPLLGLLEPLAVFSADEVLEAVSSRTFSESTYFSYLLQHFNRLLKGNSQSSLSESTESDAKQGEQIALFFQVICCPFRECFKKSSWLEARYIFGELVHQSVEELILNKMAYELELRPEQYLPGLGGPLSAASARAALLQVYLLRESELFYRTFAGEVLAKAPQHVASSLLPRSFPEIYLGVSLREELEKCSGEASGSGDPELRSKLLDLSAALMEEKKDLIFDLRRLQESKKEDSESDDGPWNETRRETTGKEGIIFRRLRAVEQELEEVHLRLAAERARVNVSDAERLTELRIQTLEQTLARSRALRPRALANCLETMDEVLLHVLPALVVQQLPDATSHAVNSGRDDFITLGQIDVPNHLTPESKNIDKLLGKLSFEEVLGKHPRAENAVRACAIARALNRGIEVAQLEERFGSKDVAVVRLREALKEGIAPEELSEREPRYGVVIALICAEERLREFSKPHLDTFLSVLEAAKNELAISNSSASKGIQYARELALSEVVFSYYCDLVPQLAPALLSREQITLTDLQNWFALMLFRRLREENLSVHRKLLMLRPELEYGVAELGRIASHEQRGTASTKGPLGLAAERDYLGKLSLEFAQFSAEESKEARGQLEFFLSLIAVPQNAFYLAGRYSMEKDIDQIFELSRHQSRRFSSLLRRCLLLGWCEQMRECFHSERESWLRVQFLKAMGF